MKLKMSESQFNRVKPRLTEENVSQYGKSIKPFFYTNKISFKGYEIDEITSAEVLVRYKIDIDLRKWGIKGISLYDIVGNPSIEVEVSYYVNEQLQTEIVNLPINWGMVSQDETTGGGVITVGDEIDFFLSNDDQGGIVVERMTLEVYKL